jgi:RimJ/RimL family protein N-acetyltransferase
MSEAVRGLIDAAHATHHFELIVARALADNDGSLNVLEKAGFKRVGKKKSETAHNLGKPVVLLELVRPRWM